MNRPAVGYFLSLADVDITFLVRAGRKSVLESPQWLYCYDDASRKGFDSYNVVENVADLASIPRTVSAFASKASMRSPRRRSQAGPTTRAWWRTKRL